MLDRLRVALERRLAKLASRLPQQPESPQSTNARDVRGWRALGNKFLADGDLDEAERCFRNAQTLNANDSDTLTCLGYTLKEMGRYAEARVLLRRAVALMGNVPDAHEATYLIGQIAEIEEDLESAVRLYKETLSLNPEFSPAFEDVCRIYGQPESAQDLLNFLEGIVAASASNGNYHYRYGALLMQAQQYSLAIAQFDEAILHNPNFAEAYCDRGIALSEAGAATAAVDSFSKAIELSPRLAQAYSNRGALLQAHNELSLAISDFQTAASLAPENPIPLINLSEVLRATRDLTGAIHCCDLAIAMDPSDPRPRWNKALALLLRGDLAQGFACYESRHAIDLQWTWPFVQPMWVEGISLDGKTILLHSEQGLGDTIQFCRYVPTIVSKGARVILEVQHPLLSLLRDIDGVVQVVAKGDQLPSFDYHCPLMSLPFALKTDQEDIPGQQAYLSSTVECRTKWSEKLGEKTSPRVGLVWSGNALHKNDHNRSISLSKLVDFLPQECSYFSLQKEVRPTDQAALDATPWIRHFGGEIADFTDTAALCELMDVVVCVDTSVAHLSAALGRPTWILLPYSVDWRWMLDRTDSPWYPTAKLYRQEKIGEWDEALDRVRTDLRSLF